MKELTDKEHEYFVIAVRSFVRETSERFNIEKEDAIEKIKRELKSM